MSNRIDVDSPLWDQSTFYGRFRHFAWMTNPLNNLVSTKKLIQSKMLIEDYKNNRESPSTTKDDVKLAMKLYNSSFHPDSGELQNVFGRMSFQVPGGMILTGAMMQFQKSVPQIVFWQWVNQSFNALVNYTNRNANSKSSTSQLVTAYTSATFSALGTAIGLRKFLEPRASPMVLRFVPFFAVASANCVNIPLMRSVELREGVELIDQNGNIICKSKFAAYKGISQVVFSRVFMAAPGMLLLPFVMRKMESYPWFSKRPAFHGPFQILSVGCFLLFMVPAACSLFPQTAVVRSKELEKMDFEAFESLKKSEYEVPEKLYFNKGL